MTFRKSILLLIGLSMVAALVACSSNGGGHVTPPPTVITVSLSAVTSPLPVNSATPVTATTNDPQGVTWSVTCAATNGVCGTFTSAQTAGGTANTYNAPPAPTTNVVITATSVTNTAISASTSPAITISGATLADGTYVFSLAGEDANVSKYYVAGVITISGGAIAGGEQDFVDYLNVDADSINPTGSAIAYNGDGNVQITLVTCAGGDCTNTDTNIGPGGNGTETLNGTILPLSTTGRTLITEFDAWASGSGELAPQDPVAAAATPASGYAFVLNGLDPHPNGVQLAVGGILNVDGAGTISGTGSIFDVNDGGVTSPPGGLTFNPSTVSPPSPSPNPGRVVFILNSASFSGKQVRLAGYIVDSSHIQLVETSDTYGGTLGGVAYSQGANTGTFTSANAAGTYVVGLSGMDTNNPVLQVASQLTLGAGAVTGFFDYNDIITSSGTAPATTPDPIAPTTYTLDASGAGDVTIPGITDSAGTVTYNLQLYLDGNGHALAISMDLNDTIGGAGFTQGSGVASASFNGSYGLDVTGLDVSSTGELDGAGPVSATSGAIAGTVDLNWLFSSGPLYPNTAVSGTIVTTGSSNGVLTGTITGVDATTCILVGIPSCSIDNFSYYLIDATGDNIAIETDDNQLTLGFFFQQ